MRQTSPILKKITSALLAIAVLLPMTLSAAQPDWSAYNRILKKYVHTGKLFGIPLNYINYRGLKRDPQWKRVIRNVENFPLNKLRSRKDRLAFYINTYNIFAMRMVINHYPLKSIRDIGVMNSGPLSVWKKSAGKIGGRNITLDHLEHGIIRKLGEPRIHFAIVCASLSCPDLRKEAYLPAKLETQLNDQTRLFLKNRAKGMRVISRRKIVRVTKLFRWFGGDFRGGIKRFIKRYRPIPSGYTIKANLPYDWRLNGK